MNNQKPPAIPKMKINFNQLQIYSCPHCLNTIFLDAVEIKILPSIMSPTGKREIVKIPVIMCAICRKKIYQNDIGKEEKNAILR